MKALKTLRTLNTCRLIVLLVAALTAVVDGHADVILSQSQEAKKPLENMQSEYTSLKEKDCTTIQFIEEQEGYYHARCPSKSFYKLEIEGGDLRYGLNVIYENNTVKKTIRYWYPQFFNVGNTVEWRFHQLNNTKIYHALIYRIYSASYDEINDDFQQDKQELFVIRLDKENSCILGKISASHDMNVQARQLADNMMVKCSAELNQGGVVEMFLNDGINEF